MTRRTIRREFDEAFYERYYDRESTAVVSQEDITRLAKFVTSYLDYLDVPVRTMLDAGCGIGLWRRALNQVAPGVEYTGIEPSRYLCEKFGWEETTIAGFRSRRKFDLVVCQDVLQYVEDAEVRHSIRNIARLCRGAFYLDVPTREDIDGGALDKRKTDSAIHVRSARWYRRRIQD